MAIRFRAPPAALLAAAAILTCAVPAAAQPTRDTQAPTVTIDPSSFSSPDPAVTVTITWQDNKQLTPSSRAIIFNGATVTSAFTYNGDTRLATSIGTVTLVPGSSNTLTASIRDASNNLGTTTVVYGYTPPDTVPPTVSISPGTSATSAGSLSVTINWADGQSLAPSSRDITLNGTSVTSAFSYGGSATSATSTGTVSLVPGTNTLTASIRDAEDNLGTQTVTYTYTPPDTDPPTVSISPGTSTTSSGSVAVTINWADGQSLAASSRDITLNGTSVTGAFTYGGSATSATSTGTVTLVQGANTLTASIRDAANNLGTQTVTYTFSPPTQPGAPVVDVASANPGVTPERGLCVVANTGSGSAYECGDLRIVHALQTVRLASKARTPALLYNSQFAQPFPLVAARVSLPAGASAPTRIEARVSVNGVLRATREWDGAAWTDNRPRRIALGWSALQDPTGLYPYTLEVTSWYGTTPYTTTVAGNVVVVNRSTSQYGVGWWIAGLEQLYFPADTTTRLWVGGDGSARLYRKVAAGTWVADALDRPDTLTWTGTEYARLLPAGARVYYRTDGRHTRTVNRLGYVTTFFWQAPVGSFGPYISSINLPYSKEAQRITHSIVYPVANNFRMSWISDELNRNVNFSYGLNDNRITAMTDPDGTVVRFTYGDAANPNRITAVTSVLGTVTSFGYDAAGKLSQASTALPAGNMATAFEAAESRGWSTPADSAAAYAQIDGPRTDVPDRTRFWVNRYGAPEVVENAMGHRTTLTHGDARWPALATEVRAPNGLVSRAGYDARGNLLADTVVNPLGDGRNAVTRYEYGDARWPDFVTRTTLPQGEVTEMGYDSLGNRVWQQDGRGISSRVEFRYYTAWPGDGQVRAVDGPSTAPDSVVYDRYGNVTAVKTPLGFWSYTYRDLMGRDTLTRTPIDSAQTAYQTRRTSYDAMDRVLESRSWALQYVPGPGQPAPPYDSVVVRNYYDRGLPYRTDRRATPDRNAVGTLVTRTEFDGLGRVIRAHGVDTTPADSLDDPVDRTFYALSGLVDSVTTRRGYTTRMEYDTLGRVRRTLLPGVDVAQNGNVPLYSDDPAGGVHISADTVVFAYDTLGNVLQADNRDARIARRYYPNGKLRTDTLRVRTWSGADFGRHVYGLSYTWDLDGRPLSVTHPQQLAYSYAGGQVRGFEGHGFNWDPVTGFLRADGFSTFDYDAEGRLIRDGRETFGYDDDSRLVRRIETGSSFPPGPLGQYTHDDHYGYDARGKPVRLLATMDSITNEYSGLGMVIRNHRQPLEVTRLACDPATGGVDCYVRGTGEHTIDRDNSFQYDMDPLGNEVSNRNATLTEWKGYTDHYQAGTGRQTSRDVIQNGATVSQDQASYDAAGNQTFSLQNVLRRTLLTDGSHLDAWTQDASYYFYGPDERLRAVDKRSNASADCCGMDYPATFEEFRYDALGRRVALRSRNALTGVDVIQRFVWDGDDLLAETRYPVQPMTDWMGVIHNWAEADTETVRMPLSCEQSHNCGEDTTYYRYYRDYGRVLYLHGRAMDMPRVITRVGWMPDTALVLPDFRQPMGPVVVGPRRNWQGASDGGEFASWQVTADGSVQSLGDTELSSVAGIAWPGPDISPYRVKSRGTSNGSWWGSMMDDHRDGSGLLYMRNRFYDPLTGRFTQEDPIGLAGGLNAYGFVGGDPFTFSDPFGLGCLDKDGNSIPCPPGMATREQGQAILKDAISRGEWIYAQNIPHDPPWFGDPRGGDCTDLCRLSTSAVMGAQWLGRASNGGYKASTGMFRLSGDHPGFVRVDDPQPGDVVVQGGHAGLFVRWEQSGNPVAWQNGGCPHTCRGGYHDGATGEREFRPGMFGGDKPYYFRAVNRTPPPQPGACSRYRTCMSPY